MEKRKREEDALPSLTAITTNNANNNANNNAIPNNTSEEFNPLLLQNGNSNITNAIPKEANANLGINLSGSGNEFAQYKIHNETADEIANFDDGESFDATTTTKPKKPGRRKIDIEFIDDKNRRHITFSKRKAGIMKKAYELSTLTGTQVLLLVASETGHVYTFATPKLQPIITRPEGKQLIQSCLNSPDPISTTNSQQQAQQQQVQQQQQQQMQQAQQVQQQAQQQQAQQQQQQNGNGSNIPLADAARLLMNPEAFQLTRAQVEELFRTSGMSEATLAQLNATVQQQQMLQMQNSNNNNQLY